MKKQHEYLRRLQAARKIGTIENGFVETWIAHDDDCPFLNGKRCSCDPEIVAEQHGKRLKIHQDGTGTIIRPVAMN